MLGFLLKRILASILWILPCVSYSGNIPYRFIHIDTDDGLPHNYTFSVVQDNKGFIWIGTNNGLARYDGYNFKIFQPNPDKPHSIKRKPANSLHVDKRGNLWIMSQGMGFSKMNIDREYFTFYSPDSINDKKIYGNIFRRFFEDRDSNFWVSSDKGLNLYDSRKDGFILVYPKNRSEEALLGNNVSDIAEDSKGNIWFATAKGIGYLNRNNLKITSVGEKLTSNYRIKSISVKILRSHEGNIWFSTESHGLFCYNVITGKVQNYFKDVPNIENFYFDKKGNLYLFANKNLLLYIEKQSIEKERIVCYKLYGETIHDLSFKEDRSGNIWISSGNWLAMFSPEQDITYYFSNKLNPGALSNNNIVSIFIDNAENLWVCTYRNGIDKADLKQKPFRWFLKDQQTNGKCIAGNFVNSVYEDRHKKMWISCFGEGLTCYDPATNNYTTIPVGHLNPFKLEGNTPFSMYEDHKGFLWLGIDGGQLDRLNLKTMRIDHFLSSYPKDHPNHFIGNNIRKITGDKNDNVWFVTDQGIIEYERSSQKFIYHSVLYEKEYSRNFFYRTVHIDNNGIIWAGSNNGGLIKYDKNLRRFTHFLNDPAKKNSISSNTVYAIYEDAEGNFWVGTSNGLNKFDRRTETFTQVKQDKVFNRKSIYSISPDTMHNLWMSTDHGIARLNIKTLECTYYFKNDGLLSNEYITTSQCVSHDGEIFLGSPKGLISFYPHTIEMNPYKARPTITDFFLFNKSIAPGDSVHGRLVLQKQISATKNIVLHYYENDFTFEFSALHFAAPENNIYSYKLEGFNEDWVTTDANHRRATYAGLPHGNYTFRLKASNNDRVLDSSTEEVTLEIVIEPPFWKTWWFKILVVLWIGGIIGIIFRLRLYRLKKNNELLELKVEERTLELKEVNVLLEERQEEINLQKEEIEAQCDKLEEANQLLTKQKDCILDQNEELDKHRNNLQMLIDERTRELEKALCKAEESDRLKSAFLSNMSHEIRTPMNAIIGFSLLLREKGISEKERDEFIDIIINNGNSLLVLINDILDLSKIQSNQLVLFPATVNLTELLEELRDTYTVIAAKRGLSIKLVNDIVPGNFMLLADEVRLKQVLGNLLTNAVKFTESGEIEFGVKDVKALITFYVKDTGIGIPKNIVGDSIFERFMKIEKTPDKIFRGTGLGLSISKNLVERWNGSIWYESELNKGTTFYFTHPAVSSLQLSSKPEIDKYYIPDLKDKIILIAEDEIYNFTLLKMYIEKTKAKLIWVKNGFNTT